ncbi:MAG: hypothetical protein ACRDNS_21360, partial [Trebonia sp.]
AGTHCTPISGASSATYELKAADVGSYVTVVVTATNSGGAPTADATPAGPILPLAPSPSQPPSITRPASPSGALTCSRGQWAGSPSFAYQWQRDGSPISGATSSDYTIETADAGHTLTCVVTATNAGGSAKATSPPVKVPAPTPTPTVPANSASPTITGTPLPGHTLTCDPGTWTGNPTFSYQWLRSTSPITGATTSTYTVTILDEGSTITCAVTASDSAGSSGPVSAGREVVAQKGTLKCPRPSGRLSGTRIGSLKLDMLQKTARHRLSHYKVKRYGFDDFCLYGGWGIRAGYVKGRLAIALTSNPYYNLRGVKPGTALATVARHLRVGKVFHIGRNDWYITPGRRARGVLYV